MKKQILPFLFSLLHFYTCTLQGMEEEPCSLNIVCKNNLLKLENVQPESKLFELYLKTVEDRLREWEIHLETNKEIIEKNAITMDLLYSEVNTLQKQVECREIDLRYRDEIDEKIEDVYYNIQGIKNRNRTLKEKINIPFSEIDHFIHEELGNYYPESNKKSQENLGPIIKRIKEASNNPKENEDIPALLAIGKMTSLEINFLNQVREQVRSARNRIQKKKERYERILTFISQDSIFKEDTLSVMGIPCPEMILKIFKYLDFWDYSVDNQHIPIKGNSMVKEKFELKVKKNEKYLESINEFDEKLNDVYVRYMESKKEFFLTSFGRINSLLDEYNYLSDNSWDEAYRKVLRYGEGKKIDEIVGEFEIIMPNNYDEELFLVEVLDFIFKLEEGLAPLVDKLISENVKKYKLIAVPIVEKIIKRYFIPEMMDYALNIVSTNLPISNKLNTEYPQYFAIIGKYKLWNEISKNENGSEKEKTKLLKEIKGLKQKLKVPKISKNPILSQVLNGQLIQKMIRLITNSKKESLNYIMEVVTQDPRVGKMTNRLTALVVDKFIFGIEKSLSNFLLGLSLDPRLRSLEDKDAVKLYIEAGLPQVEVAAIWNNIEAKRKEIERLVQELGKMEDVGNTPTKITTYENNMKKIKELHAQIDRLYEKLQVDYEEHLRKNT